MGFALSDGRGHPLGVVLEIHKSVALVQLHLKLPEHGKTRVDDIPLKVAAHKHMSARGTGFLQRSVLVITWRSL
jgi:hypothetical protein